MSKPSAGAYALANGHMELDTMSTNTNTGAANVAANKSAINRILATGEPYAVIVRRYWDRVAPSKLYSVRVRSVDWLKGATGESERRFFKARISRTYTEAGYLPYRWSCRQWGTNRLNIQLYEIVKAEEAAKVEQFERKEV